MKKINAFCLVILAIVSCQKDHSTKIELTSDYFPLRVGNYWNFDLTGKYFIKDSMISNGNEYFETINDNGTSTFYTNRDNKIYVREFSLDNKEEMKFDLTARINDTWNYGIGSVRLVNRNATITIGNTKLDNCLEFDFYNNNLQDYFGIIWLAPDIGLIQQVCTECFGTSGSIMKLLKAKINDRVIEFK